MKIEEQIRLTKAEMENCKPRSQRKIELQSRLRDLMVKQLRFENRIEKRRAA